jgi:uncharacterized protein (DUF1501 family)
MYGPDVHTPGTFARNCLLARRLAERGVKYISNFGLGFDHHSDIVAELPKRCAMVDQPVAALVKDLKQRGLLEETLVVIGTEFGRTPGFQNSDGRDHHPYGFSVALAGGGVKGGIAHGATDEIGFHAVEDRHYVTDLHATVLHQLGLDR